MPYGDITAYTEPSPGVKRPLRVIASAGEIPVYLVNSDGSVTVQNPVPCDGDSVYKKDIWVAESTVDDWTDADTSGESVANIPFTNLHTRIKNATSDNPKELFIHFNRTIAAHQVGLGCYTDGNFSNIKLELLGSGGVVRTAYDDSANNTKYTSLNIPFEPQLFNAIKLYFYTADEVCLSNITIQKSVNVSAQLQGLRADNTLGTVNVTNGNNLKVSIEEFETDVSTNSNTQLKTTVYDEAGNPLEIDDTTGSANTVNYEHHEIHSGSHFNLCDYSLGVGLSDEIEFIVTTPDTTEWGHLTFEVFSSTGATVDVYEGASGITGGTSLTPMNNNRNSSHVSVMTVLKDPTAITSDGVKDAGYLAGANRTSGFVSRENEVVLKQNETYLLRITSLAASNNISWCFEWYEHTNKV